MKANGEQLIGRLAAGLTVLVGLALTVGFGVSVFLVDHATLDSRHSTSDLRTLSSGWGLDAIVARHLRPEQRPTFLQLLEETPVRYLRERNHGDSRDPEIWRSGEFGVYADLRERGFEAVAFATLPGRPVAEIPGNQLREDLLTVYDAARELGRQTGGLVAAWELPNEPDVHYVKDLPDRFAAYSKAIYLGLRDGTAGRRDRQPAVLMGALGNFPGPWLDRAAANGLFDYTDALNVHFYGHARDLGGAIRAHREFAESWTPDRTLPVWVTECGINAVPFDDFEEARGREIQRAFTVETARTALEEDVAVFMPFVMAWRTNPFWSLIRDSGEPYPAWTAYADFTRENPLRRKTAVARPAEPNRIVVQWLPDNSTCIPHKVSGTYWFRGIAADPEPIRGSWWVYNFSARPVVGRLEVRAGEGRGTNGEGEGGGLRVTGGWGQMLRVGAFSRVEIPVEIGVSSGGYVRERVTARFTPAVPGAGLRESVATVGFETVPNRTTVGNATSLVGSRPDPDRFEWIWAPEPPEDVLGVGPWLVMNRVGAAEDSRPVGGEESREGSLSRTSEFVVDGESSDPRLPPMAVTRVDGLPLLENGFLRLRYLGEDSPPGGIRLDLVDEDGQRFSVAEGLGRNPVRSNPEMVLLAYADFHPYAFGRLTDRPIFRPEAIREVQLRFYPVRSPATYRVQVDVVGGTPRGP